MRVKATHCEKGHEFTAANTRYFADGRRYCRICKTDYQKMYRHATALIQKNKADKLEKRSAAIHAYLQEGESAKSIEQRLGVPNQTLYRHLAKQKAPKKIRPKGFLALCWHCGEPLKNKRKKLCGSLECLRAAGLPIAWSAQEMTKIERLAAAGVTPKGAVSSFPERSYGAVKHQLLDAKKRLRSGEMQRAA